MTTARVLSHLKHSGLCIVWHDKAEVGAVFSVTVFLFHLSRKLLRANRGFKAFALAAVFHSDVEVTVITGGANGRQD